ncbi:ribonuclease H2 subunit B-like [Actinia tenebrosa]|uniref:Ribonuclease H2 subunit B n=1 Tax=Actinia tenebrosa TaxID=6105 RepID=A0A6P8HJ46_ACTTE|nr:ribonuclease H2 subunit B-like [Actinia tenebrosa]
MSQGKKKEKSPSQEKTQWILIAPETALNGSSDGKDDEPTFVKLLHPRTEKECMFLMSRNKDAVYEIMKFAEGPRSWFIEDSVQKDGSLLVTTSIDPIFLCIPYLTRNKTKFRTIDQVLMDDDYPAVSSLSMCVSSDVLSNVCDCKGNDDLQAYRLNEDKLIAWLKTKVECVADKLESSKINVSKGSQSATFVRSKLQSNVTRDDYLRYSCGIVCQYLDSSWADKLQAALNLPEEKTVLSSPEEPPSKRTKLNNDAGTVLEDYSKEYEKIKTKTTSKTPGKMTAAQKSLSKVNKNGMKSMASFFTKK